MRTCASTSRYGFSRVPLLARPPLHTRELHSYFSSPSAALGAASLSREKNNVQDDVAACLQASPLRRPRPISPSSPSQGGPSASAEELQGFIGALRAAAGGAENVHFEQWDRVPARASPVDLSPPFIVALAAERKGRAGGVKKKQKEKLESPSIARPSPVHRRASCPPPSPCPARPRPISHQ